MSHDLGVDASPTTAFYRHGWNSWSPTGWSSLTESPLRIYHDADRLIAADDVAGDRPAEHEGSAVGALELPDGRVVLLGALGLGTPRVGASARELWGTTETRGDGWLIAVGEEAEVFSRYSALLAERLGRPVAPTVETVWCSWYSFFEDVDESGMIAAVEDLGPLPFDVVQLDDGWERCVGDWAPNAKFPAGMAYIAEVVERRGSRAGLWLAPFIALPQSDLAREHPDWLLLADDGSPVVAGFNWESAYFALDTTHPAVQGHLRRLFADVVGWGFRYLKLDFLAAGAMSGHRHVDEPREAAYRSAIALIRDTVGPEVYLLGCGAPMIPSVGILDGMRVGPDTATEWAAAGTVADPSHEGALNAIAASLERWWMRDLFQVDPDVAFFGSTDNTLTPPQKRTIADVARVSGFRATSDRVATLTPTELLALSGFLDESPVVERIARYGYRVDDAVVDFSATMISARSGRAALSPP